MKKLGLSLLLAVFVGSHAFASGSDTDKRVTDLIERAGVPGLSLAIIKDGNLAYTNSYGVADTKTQAPVQPDQVFQAASLSKPMFAYIVMRLVEKGELTLDQPLSEFLDYDRFTNKDYAAKITARMVLSHQPGLPNWGGTPLDFKFEPGTRFSYSGEGYYYLQSALEAKMGMSLEQIAVREVFAPLGMEHSTYSINTRTDLNPVTPHDNGGMPVALSDVDMNAAASLYTNASDYAKFMTAMLQEKGLKSSSFEELTASQVGVPIDVWSEDPQPELTGNLFWTLGWGREETTNGPVYWHWGDNGAFKAFVIMSMDKGDALAYFANAQNGLYMIDEAVSLAGFDGSVIANQLEYPQIDTPGYSEALAGAKAEAQGDYSEAVRLYRIAAEKSEVMAERVGENLEWLGTYAETLENPKNLTADEAAPYTGTYGPRVISYRDGVLYYRRGTGAERQLYPIGDNSFIFNNLAGFRLELPIGSNGLAERAIGHYSDGSEDRFNRDQ